MKSICKRLGLGVRYKKKPKKKRVCNDRNGQWSNFLPFILYI